MIEHPLSPLDRLLVEIERALETVSVSKPAASRMPMTLAITTRTLAARLPITGMMLSTLKM
jgi:ubiquinone biosynthesis monooxygenase Coq7